MPSKQQVVSIHLIPQGNPQKEIKVVRYTTRHCHYNLTKWDLNPVLSRISQLVADMQLKKSSSLLGWSDKKAKHSTAKKEWMTH